MYEIFENLLKERGLRPADISKATGIRSGVFSDWKAGRGQPKIDKLFLIAKSLDIPLEYLLTGEMPSFYVSGQEGQLLELFRCLSSIGQDKVMEYLDDLVRSGKYEKKTQSSSRSAG